MSDKKTYFIILFFGLLFFLRARLVLEPDFGWHIRLGQIILAKGIPRLDPFSYTMTHYPLIASEWLSELSIAMLYPLIGYAGLAVCAAAVLIAVLYLAYLTVPRQSRFLALLPLFLASTILLDFAAIRPQIISFLFFAFLLKILSGSAGQGKLRLFFPLFFILWVNLHGGFAAGITALAIFIAAESIKQRKIKPGNILLILSCLTATFINPFGPAIWKEVFLTVSSVALRRNISEWLPAYYVTNIYFWLLVVLSLFLIARYRRKFTPGRLSLYLFFLFSALFSAKQIPLFVIVSLPMVSEALRFLQTTAGKIKYGRKRLTLALKFLGMLFVLFFPATFYLNVQSWQALNEELAYPAQAVRYLRNSHYRGNIFSVFEWNGYLGWKLPGKRVFVNGMMPVWSDHRYPQESASAFEEYLMIVDGRTSFPEAAVRYDIHWLLLPRGIKKETARIRYKRVLQKYYDSLQANAIKAGFRMVYTDETAVLLIDTPEK